VRAHLTGLDEPFELFKGFNEIFIVVGLTILYLGFAGITGMTLFGTKAATSSAWSTRLIGMGGVILLARYFTLKRRMVAPSIALVHHVRPSWRAVGHFRCRDAGPQHTATLTAPLGIAGRRALTGYYALFRVPFTVALIALSVYATVFGLALGGTFPEDAARHLPAERGRALRIITMGWARRPVIAMRFDMSDPHRVTRRAAAGFWLHVIARTGHREHRRADPVRRGHDPRAGRRCRVHRVDGVIAVVIDRGPSSCPASAMSWRLPSPWPRGRRFSSS
jgi:hypothetical protein